MPSSAVNQLQEQIEAVRREAYAAGYAAAMEALRQFISNAASSGGSEQQGQGTTAPAAGGRRSGRQAKAASGEAAPARGRGRGRGRTASAGQSREPRASTGRGGRAEGGRANGGRANGGRASGGRPQRGNNARMIQEILQSIAPRPARPAEIRTALRDRGVEMAFTSIRHALGQLEARHAVEQAGDKMWRLRGEAGAD